ncbi:hypothetical protein BGAL_0108g00160 [Botrytis galanthina]|uniref:Uncharacterized protein n=1 Tax=Botrytis galanthina TaxID=278940 RepID=A0A4S8R2B3_9HELO|nr:hypothetical protein BGAL_0108g00160 [Botrytis galanthina]
MYSVFRVPRLHPIPRIHTESLIVFLAIRKSFLTLSDVDRVRYGKKNTRDAFLNSFAPQYFEKHLHGISFKRMCDLVQDLWTAEHFLAGSDLNTIFNDASCERQQDPAFRRLINVPILGEALKTNIWLSNQQSHYKPRITPSFRIRKLLSTRPCPLPRVDPDELNFNRDNMIEYPLVSGPSKPYLGSYEDDYECSTALPFPLQHSLLAALQVLIEGSLFSFASQHFPAYSVSHFKTSPESIDLSSWSSHLHMNAADIRLNLGSGFALEYLFFFLGRLETVRDLAVHQKNGESIGCTFGIMIEQWLTKSDVPIGAINSMCEDTIILARALGDTQPVLLGLLQENVSMVSEILLQIQTLFQRFSLLDEELKTDIMMKSILQFSKHGKSASHIHVPYSEAMELYSKNVGLRRLPVSIIDTKTQSIYRSMERFWSMYQTMRCLPSGLSSVIKGNNEQISDDDEDDDEDAETPNRQQDSESKWLLLQLRELLYEGLE